ncbi:glycosyltransferase family 2 protein [soil metagenome]
MRLAIIIPIYNEAALAPRLLRRLLDTPAPRAEDTGAPITRHIHLVDDGSSDGTTGALDGIIAAHRAGGGAAGTDAITLHRHDRNRGKGAAVRTGLRAALSAGCDAVLIQDADLEYDPRDHEPLLRPILDGRADAVIGSRFLGEAHRVLYFWHSLANRFITLCSNALTNLNLSDIECCLKACTVEIARDLELAEERFGIEPELVAKFARARVSTPDGPRRARVFEVAVTYAGRTYAEGKKIRPADGLAALWCIVKYNVLE